MPSDRQKTKGKNAQPSDRQPEPANSVNPYSQLLNPPTGAADTKLDSEKEKKTRLELWKIVGGALLAFFVSASFINAAIPKYKLLIKSPAFKKDGIYEAPAGTVTIRWMMSKEQWFQEVDVNEIKANVSIKKLGDDKEDKERRFQDSLGEVTASLQPGKYEVLIDTVEHQRTEIIALDISSNGSPAAGSNLETAELTGIVVDQNDAPIQGAKVTINEMPGMKPVETSSEGVFIIKDVPRKYYDRATVRVIKEGYQPNPSVNDVVIGASPPRIRLRRDK